MPGFIRFRKHQVAKQTALLTAVNATRILPFRGPIEVNPARTPPDVDMGNLDEVLAPHAGAKEVTGSWTGPVDFDSLAVIYSAGLQGGVVPTGGAAKTYTYQLWSTAAGPFDTYSDEWGDDTSEGAGDGIIGVGGILDNFTLGFGENLDAWQLDGSTVYADATLGDTRTTGLTPDDSPPWMYGADTEVYLDSAAGSIGTTKLTDTVHSAQVSVQNNVDRKRFANGSNTRFAISAYGRAGRTIEVQLTVAKTAATIAERATIDDGIVPDRFIELRTTSPEIITGVTPYSNSIRVPARLITATDGEIGGNATITFTYRAFYSSTLAYAFRAVLVNALAALP